MSIRSNIKKILLLTLWLVIGSGVLVLLVAAINKKNHKACKDVDIEIRGISELCFLDKQEVMNVISYGGIKKIVGTNVNEFNLQKLESALEKNIWVKDAELFFDNNNILHINIEEREPVARVFNTEGESFFIDSSGAYLPLSDKMVVKLPVFTNFPSSKKKWKGADSLLVSRMKKLAWYIGHDDFWISQTAQVDITPNRYFEIVPLIGDHVIELGDGENYENKFRRLMVFYKQVLSKNGFNIYSRINVQYDSQVVATKRGTITKIDSIQTVKNIRKLIEEAKELRNDTLFTSVEKNMTPSVNTGTTLTDLNAIADSSVHKELSNVSTNPSRENPEAKKKILSPNPVKKQEKPKAVMPPKKKV